MSGWTDFVKKYAKSNNISYKEALKKAAPEYRKSKGKKMDKESKMDKGKKMGKEKKKKKK
jgi:hypothetical protein